MGKKIRNQSTISNLNRWVEKESLPRIDSFNELKDKVENHASSDYVFFPFLLGYVRRFLKEDASFQDIKICTLNLIFELLIENRIELYFVKSDSMTKALWNSTSDVNLIISRISSEWEKLGKEIPELNEIAWIQTPSPNNNATGDNLPLVL